MPLVVTPKAYIIGPALVYYREVGVSTAWTSAGATLDDAVMRVTTEWFRPDNLSGVKGPVMGLDVLRRVEAEIEFTLGEVAGASLALALPGAQFTAEVHADAGGTPGSTTTTAAIAAGVTTVPCTAVTNFAVGDYFRIDATTLLEYRQITAINALNISFRDPLLYAHAGGVAVVETTGDKRDSITAPVLARQPDSAYKEWSLVSESGNGYHELRIPRGISQTESLEMTVADDAVTGVRVTIGARYLGSDLTISPFTLYVPAA
jgi:hypothetical protein